MGTPEGVWLCDSRTTIERSEKQMIALLWLLFADAPAPETLAQRAAHLAADAGVIEPKLVFLTSQYLQPELYDTHEPIDARVSDGEILSLLGDWVRASIVLYDVVSRPENKTHPLYDRALFYLGESEYQTRNYYEARAEFQQLIERGSKEYLFEAFGRLVEIADLIHDYSGVEQEVAKMRSGGAGKLRPDVAYHYGKSLERRGESALAAEQLLAVPLGHKFYYRARYILGVGQTRQGRMQESAPYFLEAAQAKNPLGPGAKPEEEQQFSELCWLALARVDNELGKSAEALDAYQNIAQKSPYFDDMLYEVAWNFVRQAALADKANAKQLNFQKALDAIDLLLLSENERALMPEARLLKGNVLLKLDRPDEAGTAFNSIINRYGSTKIELDKIERDQKDPVVYFNRVIAKNQGVFNAAAFLPPLAVPFVSGEQEVTQALGIANDLESGKSSIAEARLIAEKLREALKTRRAVEFYPRLQEGESRSIELEANTLVLFERAVALEREVGFHLISRERWPPLDQLAREKDVAARAYRALPATRDQIQKRREARERDFAALADRAFHLRYDVQAQRAQLVAAKKYAADSEAAHTLDQAAASETRRQVAEALEQVGELEFAEKRLEVEIEEARTSYALSDDPRGNEEIARQKYVASLERELNGLDDALQGVPAAEVQQEVRHLHAVRQRLLGYTQRLDAFRAALDDIVAHKSAEMLKLVAAEEINLGDSEHELRVCQKDSSELVGAVAYRAFEVVRKKFFQLLLKADVGGIDTAWAEKEEQTQAINKLVVDQKEALKALDKDFEDVLHGDDDAGDGS